MEIETIDKGGYTIVKLNGVLTGVDNARQVKKVWDALDGDDRNTVIVDLKDITFADSTGIATLIVGYKKMKQKGGNLFIANSNSTIKDIFRVTKLDVVFKLFDSVSKAEQHISN